MNDDLVASRSDSREALFPERGRAGPAANEIERDNARSTRKGEQAVPGRESPPGGGQAAQDERLVKELDERLAKADLAERGWHGRDELKPLLEDLQRLARSDFERAEQLWSKYRPQDRAAFLEEEDLSADQRRQEKPNQFLAPESVRKRFIQAEDRFYFREEGNDLAFEDHGKRLSTPHDDPTVALSMMQVAEAKGWQAVTLRGSDEFRREAWLHASLRDIEVRGYEPRAIDRTRLAELQELSSGPSARPRQDERVRASAVDDRVEQPALSPQQELVLATVQAVWRHKGASEREIELASAVTLERFQNQRVYAGKLVDRGDAPFEHDARNAQSFFIKLETSQGEKLIWGADLARALTDGRVQVGDEVVVAHQGRERVSVRERDSTGRATGSITALRNAWRIDTLDSLQEEARNELRQRAGGGPRAPVVPIYDRAAPRRESRADVRIEHARDQERSR